MNQFETLAIMTVIDNIEAQLRGVKTLLAAARSAPGAPARATQNPVPPADVTSYDLSDDDEDAIDQAMRAQQAMLDERSKKIAEAMAKVHGDTWAATAADMAPPPAAAPSEPTHS